MPKKQETSAENQQIENQEVDAQQQTEDKEAAVIYLGPVIAGVAVPGKVYQNGLTPQLKKAVEELPVLKRLLVKTANAQQTRKDLKNPQSAASICYQSALEYAKKGEKG